MSFELKICFGKSASQNYQDAIKLSKKFDEFIPFDESNDKNTIIISIDEFREKHKKIENLWFIISSWKSSNLLLNDDPIDFNDLRGMLSTLQCSDEYYKAVLPKNHCKNYNRKIGWGCKFLNSINNEITSSNYYYNENTFWFDFGKFTSENIWTINKQELKESLLKEAKSKNLFLCEIFEIPKLMKLLITLSMKLMFLKLIIGSLNMRKILMV